MSPLLAQPICRMSSAGSSTSPDILEVLLLLIGASRQRLQNSLVHPLLARRASDYLGTMRKSCIPRATIAFAWKSGALRFLPLLRLSLPRFLAASW